MMTLYIHVYISVEFWILNRQTVYLAHAGTYVSAALDGEYYKI